MTKKLTRGISKEFADAFKKCKLYSLYENHRDELLIGVRNNYLNVYHNCNSIAKITYGRVYCDINKYYLGGEEKRELKPKDIYDRYEEIKKHSEKRSDERKNRKRKALSKLVLLNNANQDSNWFCIDVEYVKPFRDQKEKDKAGFSGRFDVIALSKEQPHRVALIKLKYGSGAIDGKSGKNGIYEIIKDFSKFREKKVYETHLKKEIIEIIKSLHYLEIPLPFELPLSESKLSASPEFYVITLNNNAEKAGESAPKQIMAGYLFKDKRWGCRELSSNHCVERDFGDVTKKGNGLYVTFLFSTETIDNVAIDDIIDDDRYERP